MFLRLPNSDGSEELVNVHLIACVSTVEDADAPVRPPQGTRTLITLRNGKQIASTRSYSELEDVLQAL